MPAGCMNCSEPIGDRPNRQCDCCRRTIHIACTGLAPDDRITRSRLKCVKIICNSCCANFEQFADMKQTLQTMRSEMNSKFAAFEINLSSLETKINLLNTTSCDLRDQKEDIVREAVERVTRSRNIIIQGVPEVNGSTEDRKRGDEETVYGIVDAVGCTTRPGSVIRLGKPRADGRPRAIRATFPDPVNARGILRNKARLLEDRKLKEFRIHDDKTKSQQDQLEELRKELQRRKDAGEVNLTIKYVKGFPQIVAERQKK